MPIHLTISHPTRLVVAIAKETLTLKDIELYLDEVVVKEAMGYRKIFDLSHAEVALGDNDIMQLGARISAYAVTARMGPLAIVAATPEAVARARLFTTLASAERPIKIFGELHEARRWLDSVPGG
ncbi:MAG: hypothetical protein KIT25_07190 [Enhydrobacter sp.]|nr:MAG: hypothetical protein KIT25_07190 [Enhydrobacter sp.]